MAGWKKVFDAERYTISTSWKEEGGFIDAMR
jgi:hypothetical protein